jgi:hypothetical protein
MILRIFFSTHTTLHLHSQTVCDKLFFILAPFVFSGLGAAPTYLNEMGFFIKYYGIAFSILPGLAGGLAR